MTAQRYNPNNPAVIGNEWMPVTQAGVQLGDGGTAIAMNVAAYTGFSEHIDTMYIYIGSQTDPGTGQWQAIIYEFGEQGALQTADSHSYGNGVLFTPVFAGTPSFGGDPTSTGAGCLQAEPTADVSRSGLTGSPDNVNLYANVDGWIGTWSTASYIDFTTATATYVWKNDPKATFRTMPGRQVAGVLVGIYARQGASATTLTPYLRMDGVDYAGSPWQGASGATTQQYFFYEWSINPQTNLPWTSADIDNFDGTANGYIVLKQAGAASPGWRVYQTSLFVNFFDDTRVGLSNLPVTGQGGFQIDNWNRFIQIATPTYMNMLSADESSFETTTANWVAGANTSISRSNAQADQGTWSLALEAVGAGAISASSTVGAGSRWPIPIKTGETYYLLAEIRANTTPRTATLSITWLDKDFVVLSTDSGTPVADNNAGWTDITVDNVVAPAGACFMSVGVSFAGAVSFEIHYIDALILTRKHANYLGAVGWVEGGAAQSGFSTYSGQDLFALFYRLPGGSGGPSVNIIDAGSAIPMPPGDEIVCYQPQLASYAGYISDTGDQATFGFGLVFGDLSMGGDPTPESQIYGKYQLATVVTGSPLSSETIPTPVNQDYGFVKCTVALIDNTVTEPLEVSVWDSITLLQISPTYTIDVADMPSPIGNLHTIGIPPISLFGVTNDVFVKFETADTTGWYVGQLVSYNPNFDPPDNPMPLMVTIATLPDTPSCFTVVTA